MKRAGKIVFVMYAVTALGLFALAFLVQKTGLSERGITVGVGAVCAISCFLGGFLAGKMQKTRKFLWGLLMGTVYAAVMSVLSFFVKGGFSAGAGSFLWNFLLCCATGMLGGMVS